MPSLGESVKGGDVLHVLVKVGDTVAADRASSNSRPTRRRSKCRRRVRASSRKWRSRTATRSPSVSWCWCSRAPRRRLQAAIAGLAGRHDRPRPRRPRPRDARPRRVSRWRRRPRHPASPPRGAVRRAKGAGTGAVAPPRPNVPAAPSVRRLARELGLDIADVPGSGKGGRDQRSGRARARQERDHRQGRRAGRRRACRRRLRLRAAAGLLGVRRRRAQGDARHPPQDRRAHGGQLAHHSARHAVREGGHHRARAAAQAVRQARRGRRRQAHGDVDHHQGDRRRRCASSRSSTPRSTSPPKK